MAFNKARRLTSEGYITICTNAWLCPNTWLYPGPGYAPKPGNLRWLPTSPSDVGSINVDPISAFDHASPEQIASQKNSLPLL
jgi:hypothetical protein